MSSGEGLSLVVAVKSLRVEVGGSAQRGETSGSGSGLGKAQDASGGTSATTQGTVHGSRVLGKMGYLKVDVGSYGTKTDRFRVGPSVSIEEQCTFRIGKSFLSNDDVLTIRLKVVSEGSMLGRLPGNGSSKLTFCSAVIRAKELAEVGSPENCALFPLTLERPSLVSGSALSLLSSSNIASDEVSPVVAHVELAVYWCRTSELPTSQVKSASKRRIPYGVIGVERVIGLESAVKDEAWSDNPGGIANWEKYSKLYVDIFEAKGLLAADSGGTSDPYCVVSCRGCRFSTHHIPKTLCPKWVDESFSFPPGDEVDEEDVVHIVVRDKDRVGNDDDLGQVVVPIWSVIRSAQENGDISGEGIKDSGDMWLELTPTNRQKGKLKTISLGWVRVRVQFKPRARAEVGPTLSVSDGTPATSSAAVDRFDPTLNLSPAKPMLAVRLVQARNLCSADANGFSDPFCKLQLNRQVYRSRALHKTLHPRWNQQFLFGSRGCIADDDELQLTVFDRDFSVTEGISDDKLGTVSIPVHFFKHQAPAQAPMWFALHSDKYNVAGEVQVAVQYIAAARQELDEKSMDMYNGKEWEYKLKVSVLDAKALRTSDPRKPVPNAPYCTIQCGAATASRTKARKGAHPIWSEKFTFAKSVRDGRSGLGRMDRILLVARDERRAGAPLGHVDISLGEVLDAMGYVDKQGAEVTKYFELQAGAGTSYDNGLDGDEIESKDASPEKGQSSDILDGMDMPDAGRDSGVGAGSPGVFRRTLKLRRSTSSATSSDAVSSPAAGADGASSGEEDGLTKGMSSGRPWSRTRRASIEGAADVAAAMKSVTSKSMASTLSPRNMAVAGFDRISAGLGGKSDNDNDNDDDDDNGEENKSAAVDDRDFGGYYSEEDPIADEDLSALVGDGSPLLSDQGPSSPRSTRSRSRGSISESSHGIIRLKIVLVPVSEKRLIKATKLAVRLNKIAGVLPADQGVTLSYHDPRIPPSIYAKLKLEYEEHESVEAAFHNLLGGVCNLNAHFLLSGFDKLATAAKKLPPNSLNQPRLSLTLLDSSNDHVLVRQEWTMAEIKAFTQCTRCMVPMQPVAFSGGKTSPHAELEFRIFQTREELRPILGHFHLSLLRLKLAQGKFNDVYRTVIRYKDRVIATRGVAGDLSIDFTVSVHATQGGSKAAHSYVFCVRDMFEPVVVEVWSQKQKQIKDGVSVESTRDGKWGKLYGSVVIPMFDMLELEAQVINAERSLTKRSEWPRIKLPVERSGKARGSLWIQAHYVENIGEILTPNPNPAQRSPGVSSVSGILHEVARTQKIFGWFGAFGGTMGHLLNWENPAHSLVGILFTVLFCCVGVFTERILMLPMYTLLYFVLQKHRARITGRFTQQLTKESRAKDTNASIRIAVIGARGLFKRPSLQSPGASEIGSQSIGSPGFGSPEADFSADAGFISSPGTSPLSPGGRSTASSASRARSVALAASKMPRNVLKAGTGVLGRLGHRRSSSTGSNNGGTPKSPQSAVSNRSHHSSGALPIKIESLSDVVRYPQRRLSGSSEIMDGGTASPGALVSAPAAVASIFVRHQIGCGRPIKMGRTRTSAQTLTPQFTQSKQGYRLHKSASLHNQLINWDTPNGAYPAFQAEIHMEPIRSSVLVVRILAGTKIPVGDIGGTSDPFVTARVLSSRGVEKCSEMKTKFIQRTLEPEWNEELILGASGSSLHINSTDNLELLVRDMDAFKSEVLCGVKMRVKDIVARFRESKGAPMWAPLYEAHDLECTSASELGHSKDRALGMSSLGAICISVQSLNFDNANAGKSLMASLSSFSTKHLLGGAQSDSAPRQDRAPGGGNGNGIGAGKNSDEALTCGPDSWLRSASEIIIELEDELAPKSDCFLGCARIPIAALIENEEVLKQRVFEQWVPLNLRMDGGDHDVGLRKRAMRAGSSSSLGEVLVRLEVVLPDPSAKEKLMEQEEAKRADKSKNPYVRFKMITDKMKTLQVTLFNFNNKMEQLRNMLNWAHPRKTEVIFKVIVFLCVLFTIVPSRFIVMFISLFMFTEHFRPLGTAGLRLNHLLAVLPTDDELRASIEGNVIEAKREWNDSTYSEKRPRKGLKNLHRLRESENHFVVANVDPEQVSAAPIFKPVHFLVKSGTYVELTAEEIEEGISSTLWALNNVTSKITGSKTAWRSLYCFTLESSIRWWPSRQAFEAGKLPDGIADVVAFDTKVHGEDLKGCMRPELVFVVYARSAEKIEKLVLAANSVKKKDAWLTTLLNESKF